MHQGTFIKIQFTFPEGCKDQWLRHQITDKFIKQGPSLDAEWLGNNTKKYSPQTLFQKLTELHQQKKLYCRVKILSTKVDLEGYLSEATMEKYFEPLANACYAASLFNGQGNALFLTASEAKYKYLDLALLVSPQNVQQKSASQYLYSNLQEFDLIPPIYEHQIFRKIYSNYLDERKQIKNPYVKPEYAQKYGFVDQRGNFILEPQWLKALPFQEALAPVCNEEGLWGYIDRTGKYVLKPQFFEAYTFRQGKARVREVLSHLQSSPKYGFINQKGQFLLKPLHDYAEDFYEGLAKIRKINESGYYDKTGFIDQQGREVIPTVFDDAAWFQEDVCFVQKDFQMGVIDRKGKFFIKPKFDYGYCFSEGVAAVYKNGLCGYINKKGEYILKPQYTYGLNFSEGTAFVLKDNQWQLIDKKGEILHKLPKTVQEVQGFINGVAIIKKRNLYGLIDKNFKLILKPSFPCMALSDDGSVLVQMPELES